MKYNVCNYLKNSCAIAAIMFSSLACANESLIGTAKSISDETTKMTSWVLSSKDNKAMPFIVVDKKSAQVSVFNGEGALLGSSVVLLGAAIGDETFPGIGDKELSNIKPEERTTQAGRFVASLGMGLSGKDILWIDYDTALSMHRIVSSQQRVQRLASPTIKDNRISFGCINVPVEFYEKIVASAFKGTEGIVYILPEIKSMKEVFPQFN